MVVGGNSRLFTCSVAGLFVCFGLPFDTRVRSFKQKFAMTDVRKEANRMGFASMADEYSDTAMGLDFGMLGEAGSLVGVLDFGLLCFAFCLCA